MSVTKPTGTNARRRRRQLLEAGPPRHFCANCGTVTFDEELVCPHCSRQKPTTGWTSLKDCDDPWLGQRLDDRYLITAPLGRGSTASVYRAQSLSIHRQFALKIVATDHGPNKNREVIERIHREIEALGRLKNPHIVSVYELIDVGGDCLAAVMDLISGSTLQGLVQKEGPVDPHRACQLFRQVASGLFEAHQQQMIHRDIKPENLMIEPLPAGGDFVHILDFGIVRLERDSLPESENVAMTRGFIGTPLYASPEQIGAEEIDHRSDIYSLGAALFYTLTGHPPFFSENVYDLFDKQLKVKAPRLVDVHSEGHFSPGLEDLVARMLAKDPNGRPADLSEVIGALKSIIDDDLSQVLEQISETIEADSQAIIDSELAETSESPQAGILSIPDGLAESSSSYQLSTSSSKIRAAMSGQGVFAVLEDSLDEARLFRPQMTMPESIRVPTNSPITAISLSQKSLLAGHENGDVSRTNLDDFKTQILFRVPRRHTITAVDISGDESCLVLGDISGRVYAHQPENHSTDDWAEICTGRAVQALTLRDGDSVVIARNDNCVEVLHIATPHPPQCEFELPRPSRFLSVSPDGYLLATAFSDGSAALYQIPTGKEVMQVRSPDVEILAVDFSESGIPVAITAVGREIELMEFDEIAQ